MESRQYEDIFRKEGNYSRLRRKLPNDYDDYDPCFCHYSVFSRAILRKRLMSQVIYLGVRWICICI
jgi:hypothetical protein